MLLFHVFCVVFAWDLRFDCDFCRFSAVVSFGCALRWCCLLLVVVWHGCALFLLVWLSLRVCGLLDVGVV